MSISSAFASWHLQPSLVRRGGRCIRKRRVWGIILLAQLVIGCAETSPTRPNDIFLLVVDTLRADHLGLYGYSRPTSPALDRFAASSTVFAKVFAPAPWTLPSVASVMTGTYASVHGLRARRGAPTLLSMRPDLATLARTLREAGYRTVAIMANPWVVSPRHGLSQGFDEYRGELDAGAEELHRLAREILEDEDPRPIFLYLHYMDVHGPYHPRSGNDAPDLGPVPERYRRAMTQAEKERIPQYLRLPGAKRLDDYVDAYDRGIRAWDESFGAFTDWLARTGRLDHALVAVISDHGEEFLEHGGWNHGTTLYQEQLSIPWIMHLPQAPGRWIRDRTASLVDVAPTLLGATRVPIPSTMTGQNLLAERSEEAPRPVFSETQILLGGHGGESLAQRAMLRGHTKVIASSQGNVCFDLRRDPEEQRPIAGGPDCDAQAFQELEDWVTEARRRAAALGEPTEIELSPAEREKLRALGYIE